MTVSFRLILGGIVYLGLFLVFANSVFAQNANLVWELQSQTATPTATAHFEFVYDVVRQEGVLFGGVGPNNSFLNETWIWDGDWHQFFPANNPIGRLRHTMVYDEARKEIVLFGGLVENLSSATASNETWVWNGNNWIQKLPAHSPPARYNAAMAYDAARQEAVLFSGSFDVGEQCGFQFWPPCRLFDTWVWDGTDWTQKFPVHSPPASNFPGSMVMAYDPIHQHAILHIGFSQNTVQTWTWDGEDWQLAFATTTVPGLIRADHKMAYDPSLGGIVLFGGSNTFIPANDVWLWDGSKWIEIVARTDFSDPNVQPSETIEMFSLGLIYDTARQKLTAYGDAFSYRNLTNLPFHPNSTWVLTESTPQKRPVILIPGILGSWQKNGQWVMDPILHTYDNLIQSLEGSGYVQGINLFTFPYDWKQENALSGQQLKLKIEEVRNICQCQKADIIAHSMGGLVARSYTQSNDYQNDINQIIFLGTPHEGSGFAYLLWEGGEITPEVFPRSQDRILEYYLNLKSIATLSGSKFEYIRNNVLSIRDLLPTYNYLKEASSGVVRNYPNNYPVNPFLDALNSSSSEAKLFQRNISITNIVGNIEPNFINNTLIDMTLGAIRIVPRTIFQIPMWEHGYPENFDVPFTDHGLEFMEGDRRVSVMSANHNFQSVFLSESNSNLHSDLPTIAWPQISAALLGVTSSQQGIPITIEESLIIPILSPADIQVIDPLGRRIGKDFASGQEFNEIPLAFYSGFNSDLEFVSIPNPIDGEYEVKLQGTDVGSYEIKPAFINDATSSISSFVGYIQQGLFEDLTLSFDSSSPQPTNIRPQDNAAPTTDIEVTGAQGNNGWYISDVTASLIAQDDADGTGVFKTEYSFDGGEVWNVYTQSFIIEQEGVHTLLYRSRDFVGNVEEVKVLELKVDKTVPEAIFLLDVESFDLKIEGRDISNTAGRFLSATKYILGDEAGHTLIVGFKKVKDKNKSLLVRLESLQYASESPIFLPENKLHYAWAINKKEDEFRILNQEAMTKKLFEVQARFKQKKNETEVKIITSTKKEKHKGLEILPGLHILQLVTLKGSLNYELSLD